MRALLTPIAAAMLVAAPCVHAADEAVRDNVLQQACERSVTETVRATRGALADVSFDPANARPPVNEGVLRGSGRYRVSAGAWQAFGFTCGIDVKSNTVSGVMLREGATAAPRVAARSAATGPATAAEPDLSMISPEACESSAATALKQRWPTLAQLNFDGQSRRLEPGAAGGEPLLVGRGTVVPAPGEPATFFGYRCTIDARNGRVVGTRLVN